jgi:hypothetical protein
MEGGKGRPNYVMYTLKNYNKIIQEIDKMELPDDLNQYKNSINFFSLTLGPFEKQPAEITEEMLK